jgi:hypothetical protein
MNENIEIKIDFLNQTILKPNENDNEYQIVSNYLFKFLFKKKNITNDYRLFLFCKFKPLFNNCIYSDQTVSFI